MVPCLRDYVAMSLRGREPTEAISYLPDKKEIAALPAGARNDKEVIATQSLRGNDNMKKCTSERAIVIH